MGNSLLKKLKKKKNEKLSVEEDLSKKKEMKSERSESEVKKR